MLLKYRFGLYKTVDYKNKRLKDNAYNVINYIRYNSIQVKQNNFNRKTKTLFAKKFNKLFFRSGRRVLMKNFFQKKTQIQKYISKKIHHFIKKLNVNIYKNTNISDLLMNCGVVYTLNDSVNFIKFFGFSVNGANIYDYKYTIKINDLFSIIWSRFFFKYLKKKKQNFLNNLKKIKIYKFRIKNYKANKKIEWVPINNWLLEYSHLYMSKYNNIEFDLKSLSGLYLYSINTNTSLNYFNNESISLFMNRSYTWKYIT